MAESAVSIEIRGLDALYARLGEIAASEYLRTPMQQALALLQRDLQTYPPPPTKTWAKWQFPSDKSRRYFFAVIAGNPHKRRKSGGLSGSWTTRIEGTTAQDLKGVVGTNLSYVPWVQSGTKLPDGRGPQAWIHQGRWPTVEEIRGKRNDEIISIFSAAIRSAVEG